MREATLTAVRFPDHLTSPGGRGPARVRVLVEDPVVARIQKGDPTLGWAGDNRLALYLDVPAGMWELWRLEHDGEMRRVVCFPTDLHGSADIVPAAILYLKDHDTRIGFDPFVTVVNHNDRLRAQRDAELAEAVAEAEARVRHGLVKDGAL